jgi:hypothetical protein
VSIIIFFVSLPVFAQIRSFDEIFPDLSPEIRKTVFTDEGYYNSTSSSSVNSMIYSLPNNLNVNMSNKILGNKGGHFIEALQVIPGNNNLLEIYNALGNIRGLKDILYYSFSRSKEIPMFQEATRVESTKKNTPVPDPPPSSSVPVSDTVFMRLKDSNFGNLFCQGDMVLEKHGLKYSLVNYKNLTFMLIPVIKEEKFIAKLYFEVISEGILVYSFTGVEVSDFISSQTDITSHITKRLKVFITWVADGLK